MTNDSKPVVTGADPSPEAMALARMVQSLTASDGLTYAGHAIDEYLAEHRLAHSPSEPSVVSQDLVPVAWMYERNGVRVFKEVRSPEYAGPILGFAETPLYPASAIEAAARNDALEEAARVVELMGMAEEDMPQPVAEWIDAWGMAIETIRALRTPSQHQESEG